MDPCKKFNHKDHYLRPNQNKRSYPKLNSLTFQMSKVFVGSTLSMLVMSQAVMANDASQEKRIQALEQQVQVLMQTIQELKQLQPAISDKSQDTDSERILLSEQEIDRRVEEKVDARVAENEKAAVPDNVVTVGDTPGSFKIPRTNTSVQLDGYIKADFIYDFDQDLGDSFAISALDAENDSGDNNFRAHARQSRLRLKTNTDMGNGNAFNTHLEGDFFGDFSQGESFSNGNDFRLRHAFASYESEDWGSFMAGQYWTLFGAFNYTTTLDFYAPNGQVFVRQAQLRYSTPWGLEVSMENAETDPTGAIVGDEGGKDVMPDFVIRYAGGPGGIWGKYSASTVLRLLGVDGVTERGLEVDDEEFGWGVHLGGDWQLSDNLFATSGIAFGEGIGRYILADGSFNNDVYVSEDGDLEAIQSYGLTAGLSYNLTETVQTNFNYGRFENNDADKSSGVDNSESYHLNLLWNPWPATTLGIEGIYGERELADGTEGDATRLQFSWQQNF